MKVHLLFAPTDGGTHPRTLPLGQATLAAFLRANGVAVDQDDVDALVWRDNRTLARTLHVNLLLLGDRGRVLPYLDGRPDPYLDTLVERMARKVDVRGADLIGLSVMEPDQVLPALCLARHLKGTTGATMMLGGPNVGEETLAAAPYVDYVVMDEAEISMMGLLEHLEGTRSVEDVPGLVYRDADGAVRLNDRAHLPIEEVPAPDFSGLPMDVYALDVDGAAVLPLPYQLVKGCPSQCTFCNYYSYNLDGLRAKSMDKVVSELARLSDTYGSRHFLFLDNTFNISKRYVRDWCDAVVQEGLDFLWMDSARPTGLDRSLLDRLRASGCVRFTYGVETGSPRLLKLMRKGFTVDDAGAVLEASHDAGIWNLVNIIAGFVSETEEDIALTENFVRAHAHAMDNYNVLVFIPYRASVIMQHPEEFGIEAIIENRDVVWDGNRAHIHFDEGGVPWDRKKEVQERSRQELLAALRTHTPNVSAPAHLLFRGYELFDTKGEIVRWIRERPGGPAAEMGW
ncbi:MAG: radical SAM protein [Candidatus Undinarchaeales archaeon]|jgi:hypothetical protein|nr:radical SAM protein [Candidatus Undinarchaeales archaeon]MDP7491816.1 radical SAM protein [Candidatus Undinarchaeales archaeon]